MWQLLVLISAFCLGAFNVIAKYVLKDVKSYVFSFIFNIVCALFFLLFIENFSMSDSAGWFFVIASGVLYAVNGYVGYEVYKYLDVSLISPLTNTMPGVVLVLSVLFLGESFTLLKTLGVLLIIAGAFIITFDRKRKYIVSRKGLVLVLVNILVLSVAAVLDKVGVSFFSVEFYGFLAFLLPGLFISPFALRKGRLRVSKRGWYFIILASFLLSLSYYLVLVSYTLTLASNVISVIQLSVVISMLGGFILHKEGNVLRKVIGAFVIISGVLFIV